MYSILVFVGEIPKGMFVCHHCDIRACINPEHLFTGTQKDNMRDALVKGRTTKPPIKRGIANHKATLTDSQVREIRRLRRKHVPQRKVALMMKCSQSTVWRITNKATRASA